MRLTMSITDLLEAAHRAQRAELNARLDEIAARFVFLEEEQAAVVVLVAQAYVLGHEHAEEMADA